MIRGHENGHALETPQERHFWETEGIYSSDSIVRAPDVAARSYADKLLKVRLGIVDNLLTDRPGAHLVDLCCATGQHLAYFSSRIERGTGIDFSSVYIDRARALATENGLSNLSFLEADARTTGLAPQSVDVLYSFSSLYVIPSFPEIAQEVSRVLSPDGVCVLDVGMKPSLNAVSLRAHTELPQAHLLTQATLTSALEHAGLTVINHRRFQLLPLWTRKPWWLSPLLAPFWNRVMAASIGGRLVDEWMCSAPVLRRFAFRHLLVCRKA